MKPSQHPSFLLAASFFATATLVHAHPGHDGHDLTWDFSAGHLVTHPLGTLVCTLVLVAAAWGAARLVNAGGARLAEAARRRGRN